MWLVESLKFCFLIGSFCPNLIKFQLKKYRRVFSHDTEEWCKVKEKLSCVFKYDIRSLVKVWKHSKVWKFLFDGLFLFKVDKVWATKYRRFTFHNTEQWCRIWINPDLVVSKMAWGIGWTFIREIKSLKNGNLMGSICPKDIMLQLENFTGIMCHDTEGWCKM